jgi:hypothetical protein
MSNSDLNHSVEGIAGGIAALAEAKDKARENEERMKALRQPVSAYYCEVPTDRDPTRLEENLNKYAENPNGV